MGRDEPPEDAALRRVPAQEAEPSEIDDGLLLAYQAGRLPPDEAAKIEALLARDAEARALLVELGRPPDPALVSRLEAMSGVGSRRLLWWSVAGVASVAAAVLLTMLPPPADQTLGYTLEVEGFVAHERGGDAPQRGVLDPGSHLVLRLRPEEDTAAPPTFRISLAKEGGTPEPIEAGRLESAHGALRWSAEAEALFPEPGAYRIFVTLEGESATQEWSFDVHYRARDPGGG